MPYEKISEHLKSKARQTNLVHFLRERHPDSICYIGHPDVEHRVCWRSTKHDSITFSREYLEAEGIYIYRYRRWSMGEYDDGITYLVKYEGYCWPQAVKALAYFVDPFEDED